MRAPQSLSAALEISNIRDEVEQGGNRFSYLLLSNEAPLERPQFLAYLGPEAFRNTRKVTCLHFSGDTPFCHEERLISKDAVPEVARVSFETKPPSARLFKTVPWNAAEHQISACSATEPVAAHLAIAPGTACLVIEHITQKDTGYVTWARLTYPGDKHRLIASFSPAG